MNDLDQANTIQRLESKLDATGARLELMQSQVVEITKTLQTLARIEERMIHHKEGLSRIGKQVDTLFARVEVLERVSTTDGVKLSHVERFAWLVISTIAAVIAYKYKG